MYKGPVEENYLKTDEYCCPVLTQLIKNKIVRLTYDESMRIYLLGCVSNSGRQTLFYCFCCGKKFPNELWEKWYAILTEEYHIKDPWEAAYEGKVPSKFLTDEWWKKRGL
jgi:hypothetical protein